MVTQSYGLPREPATEMGRFTDVVAGAVDHALALLARVVNGSPPRPLLWLLDQLSCGHDICLYLEP